MTAAVSKLSIVPGSLRDFDEIMAIEECSFHLPWTEGMVLSELFEHKASTAFTVRLGADGLVMGYVFVRELFDELHLMNLAVAPKWRGKGIAGRLMQSVLDFAHAKKMQRIILEVRESNMPARKLYQKMGFKQIGLRKNYYRQPQEHAFVLQYDCVAMLVGYPLEEGH